jgi:S-formylglutathione hydrolase FrmB
MSSPAAAGPKQGRRPPVSVVLALAGIGLVLLAVAAAGGARLLARPHPAATHAFVSLPAVAPSSAGAQPTISGARIESRTFHSDALGRDMPYEVFLPPGYDSQRLRYAVVYMLHGMSGNHKEWELYGVFDVAQRMMLSGEIGPFLVVLPQGDVGYWVDHANGGPAWGRYMAQDVVSEIDNRYRTVASADHRAIGGLSMGADGALQLSLNYPGEFGAVQADSPVLRPYPIAPSYYGDRAYFEAHYPVTLVASHPEVARAIAISIDVGDADPWRGNAEAFHDELTGLAISHSWHLWPGGHSGPYWATHLPDYLRFYGSGVGPPLPASDETRLT